MNTDNLLLRITYRPPSDQKTHSYLQHNQLLRINAESETCIDFQQIIKRVNDYILEELETDNFLEIFIKTSQGFQNMHQFLKESNQRTFQLSKENQNFVLDVELRDETIDKNYGIIKNWQSQIKELYQKVEVVNNQIKKKQQYLEEVNKKLIDLAFFYAQPLVQISSSKIKPTSKEVSFQQEQSKFVRTLRNKERVVRDAFVEINVATVKNIRQALINGVQILHFSCHGTPNKLVIQDSQKIGLRYDLQTTDFIKLLSLNPPNIIVFNVCFSDRIAEQVHKQFNQITTIGYQGKANDRYCQIFAQVFYPHIFIGTKVKQAFELTQAKMGEAGKKLKICSSQNARIETSKIGLNQEKCVQILSHNEPMEEVLYGVREQIYEFITKYLNDSSKRMIFFRGPPRHGKSLFIKKCLLYIKQRKKKFDHFHIINLKNAKNIVNSMIWLREEYQDHIRQVYRQNSNTILVIDHCDQIIQNEEREFILFLKQIQKNSMVGKIIIITDDYTKIQTIEVLHEKVQKKPFTLSSTDFLEFICYKGELRIKNGIIEQAYRKKPKTSNISDKKKICQYYSPQDHEIVLNQIKQCPQTDNLFQYWQKLACIAQKRQRQRQKFKQESQALIEKLFWDIEEFIDTCKQTIGQEIQKFDDSFLTYFPIVSFINLTKRQMPAFLQLNRRRSQLTDDLQIKIDTFLDKLEEVIEYFGSQQNIHDTLRVFYNATHIIIGFKILPFLVNSSNNFTKNKFVQTYRKLIGFCLVLKRTIIDKSEMKKLMILQIKLLLLMFCLSSNQQSEFFCLTKQKLYQKTISRKYFEFIQNKINVSEIPINKLIQVYNYILKIKPNCYEANIWFENSNLYRFTEIEKYRTLYCELKSMYQKQKYSQQCQNQFEGFYGANQLQLMALPLVSLIQGYLALNEDMIQLKCIQHLINYCKDLKFLEEKLDTPCIHIFKKFIQPHISNLFTLKKLHLNKISRPKQIRRSQIIEQFKHWINICDKYSLKHLKATIQRYKNQSFNSCVALTSLPLGFTTDSVTKCTKDYRILPQKIKVKKQKKYIVQDLVLINPFRFENCIYKMLIDTFRRIQKTIFPRMDIFNKNSIQKYNTDNLPILIALFIVDCSHQKDKYEVFVENQKGLSEAVELKDINFFKSCINIFCGANVNKIKQFIDEKVCNEDTVFIFIDAILDNDKGRGYLKKDANKGLYEHIRNRKILLAMLQGFYTEFCKVMFKENHNNFIDQVNKAFEVGKSRARIQGNIKYGHYFFQIVEQIYEHITKLIKRKDKNLPPPLKISQINKSIYEDEKTEDRIEFCFNQELYDALSIIIEYLKDPYKENYLQIQYDKQEEEKIFVEALKIKIRKLGYFTRIQEKSREDCSQTLAPTASSNIGGRGNKLSAFKILQNLYISDAFIFYRNTHQEKINEIISQENQFMYLCEDEERKINRFIVFTCKSTEKSNQPQSLKISKFKKFNLAAYYLDKRLEKFISTKGNNENDFYKSCDRFLQNQGKDLERKQKKQKILDKALY